MKAQEAVKGLTLEELEGQRAELLPDRIEMRRWRIVQRKRRRSGSVTCTATNVSGLVNRASTLQVCGRF